MKDVSWFYITVTSQRCFLQKLDYQLSRNKFNQTISSFIVITSTRRKIVLFLAENKILSTLHLPDFTFVQKVNQYGKPDWLQFHTFQRGLNANEQSVENALKISTVLPSNASFFPFSFSSYQFLRYPLMTLHYAISADRDNRRMEWKVRWEVLNLTFLQIQSNAVITNSSGPAIFVRYNWGSL